ncbi:MAG: hypothetical protein C0434_12865 [Xanthomonadaceae bacterium]|nr:hypothetical protein [Xanthomonadaceae bacterium]
MSNVSLHYINGFRISLPAAVNASGIGTPIELPRDGYDYEFAEIAVTQVVGGNVVATNVMLQISEQGGTNNALLVQPQHARNLAGDGSMPWKLAQPFRVSGNVRLQCEAINLSAAAADVHVTLKARRVPKGGK